MNIILLFTIVILTTIMWPVTRWAVRRGARTHYIGIWISIVAALIGIISALLEGEDIFVVKSMLFGSVMGIAYSVGFCIIIFYCLSIGPSGPTVAMNNLGLLGPVLVSLIWFSKGKSPSAVVISGIAVTLFSLVLMAWSHSDSKKDIKNSISRKWIFWIFTGWIFSCVSLTSQFLASQYEPEHPYAFLIFGFGTSFIILVIVSLLKKNLSLPSREELIAGIYTGSATGISMTMIFFLLNQMHATTVYPVIVAGPIVLVILIGHFLLKERINRIGWISSISGIAGIILLTTG